MCSVKKYFLKFTRKHLCWSLIFNTVAGLKAVLKKVFLKIYQNSQENTCATVSFIIKLKAFIKKEILAQRFPVNSVTFLRTLISIEDLWWLFLFIY